MTTPADTTLTERVAALEAEVERLREREAELLAERDEAKERVMELEWERAWRR